MDAIRKVMIEKHTFFALEPLILHNVHIFLKVVNARTGSPGERHSVCLDLNLLENLSE